MDMKVPRSLFIPSLIVVIIIVAGWIHGSTVNTGHDLLAQVGQPIYSQGITPILVQ